MLSIVLFFCVVILFSFCGLCPVCHMFLDNSFLIAPYVYLNVDLDFATNECLK